VRHGNAEDVSRGHPECPGAAVGLGLGAPSSTAARVVEANSTFVRTTFFFARIALAIRRSLFLASRRIRLSAWRTLPSFTLGRARRFVVARARLFGSAFGHDVPPLARVNVDSSA